MEKRTPHCPLDRVKLLVSQGQVAMTRSATQRAALLGFHALAVLEAVQGLSTSDFYKSMTSYDDHRVWQDVYRPRTAAGRLYLTLIVADGVLVVSFKEL